MELDELRALLARLEIPAEIFSVLGVWQHAEGSPEVHLSPTSFWRLVKRVGAEVTSEERRDLLLPYCHRFTLEGVGFFTFSAEPVLAPGTVTPGYALRLT
jgi:hypothetical protein